MKTIAVISLGVLLSVSTGPVFASNWIKMFGWTHDGTTNIADIFIDATSVVRKGTHIKFWQKTVYTSPQELSPPALDPTYTYNVLYVDYNCATKEVATLSAIFYDADGNSVWSDENHKNYAPIIPDTIDDSVETIVCKKGWH